MMKRPQVIFLDAVGTLFGVQGSVGEQYARVALNFGIPLPIEEIDWAFIKSFKAAGTPAFGDTDASELKAKEYDWWFNLAVQTFKDAGFYHRFTDFGAFFAALYDYFESAEPWYVYPEVPTMLQRWQDLNIPLGIISNFDSRIYAVLRSLQLTPYFSSITISTEAGVAKPDRQIFEIALQKHKCHTAQAIHIGDSFDDDYQAANAAGLRGIWLRRQ
ncbi:MAG: HAD-IA family hydrolase [Leptolyngbyaceae cyanobacterium bins.349]|nr:HAD-IA family hydrolase [Leptolyngbyaceae cyanobacterium bins.349]